MTNRKPDELSALDELLKIGDGRKADDEENRREMKKIQHAISVSIYGRMVKFFLVLAGICAGTYLVLSVVSYGLGYNPKKAESFDFPEDYGDLSEFGTLMQTFSGLFMPDSYVAVHPFANIRKTGLGNYEIDASFGHVEDGYDGGSNGVIRIRWGEMSLVFSGGTTMPTLVYPMPFTDGMAPQSLTEDVEELPDSAYLYVSLVFDEVKGITEMYNYMDQYENSVFSYLATFSEEVQPPLGLDLAWTMGYGTDEAFDEKYPNFYYRSEVGDSKTLDPDAVRECYQSRIRLMLDNPDFLELAFGLVSWPHAQQKLIVRKLEQELEKSTEEITFIGCRAKVKKQDLLNMIDGGDLKYIRVHKASYSKFPEEALPRYD